MIIIDTKNGTAFVNDKMIEVCKHSTKESEVSVSDGNRMTIINDVVSIRYVSDNHDVDFKEDGNELAELQKKYYEHLDWAIGLRKSYLDALDRIADLERQVREMENVYIVVETIRDETYGKLEDRRNVACFSTSDAAEKYSKHYNEGLPTKRFTFEEWTIGESYNFNTKEQ